MALYTQPLPIMRLLLCGILTLSIPSAWATSDDTTVAPAKTLFEALPPGLEEMQITPARIPINQTTLITATIRIQYDYKPETVILRRLDNNAQHPVATLAIFHDDGEQGDNIAGDGIYTAQTNLSVTRQEIIKVDAAATFKSDDKQQLLTSGWIEVKVNTNISANNAWVSIHGSQIVFRDKNGRTIRESEQDRTASTKSRLSSNLKAKTELVFKYKTAITSPDKTHVGIIGALQIINATTPAMKEEDSNVAEWEFRYQDVTGTLWTKTTKAEFYLSDTNSLITENGDKVLLVETGEYGTDPSFTVYDQAGQVLLQEKLALSNIEDAEISNSGHYLLFLGMPPTPKLDYVNLIVINLDIPTQRWIESYRGGQISDETFIDNAQGGFDIWLNNRKRYSFPH